MPVPPPDYEYKAFALSLVAVGVVMLLGTGTPCEHRTDRWHISSSPVGRCSSKMTSATGRWLIPWRGVRKLDKIVEQWDPARDRSDRLLSVSRANGGIPSTVISL